MTLVIMTNRQKEKTNSKCCLSFGEGILLWGIVKLYNVLGGFYIDYNINTKILSVHNVISKSYIFLCTNYNKRAVGL